jgi:non-ribosomal peptide synthetase component F
MFLSQAVYVLRPLQLMIGGEGLIPSDLSFWQRRFPSIRLIAHYGSSEVMGGCCSFEITDNVAEASSIPIGRPIWNTRVYVLVSVKGVVVRTSTKSS